MRAQRIQMRRMAMGSISKAMVREKRGRRQAVRVRVCEAQSRTGCGDG